MVDQEKSAQVSDERKSALPWLALLASERAKRIITGVILALLAVIPIIPFLGSTIPYGIDLYFHLNRIQYLADSLAAGEFPARMQGGWIYGYGYPISIMYGDLFVYPFAILRLLGVPIAYAYNAEIICCNAASVFFAYFSFKVMSDSRRASLVGVTLWIFSYARLLDMYLRAGISELQAVAFLPLIACGIFLLFVRRPRNDGRRPWLWLSLGIAGVVYCHVLTVLMTILFALPAVIVGLFIRHDRYVLKNCLITFGVTLLLCAAFALPFLDFYLSVDMHVNSDFKIVNGEYQLNKPREGAFNSVLGLDKLLAPFGDMGLSNGLRNHNFSELLPCSFGWALLLPLVLFIPIMILRWHKGTDRDVLILGTVCALTALFFLFVSSSFFPWVADLGVMGNAYVELLAKFQFPWRFLIVASFMCSLVAVLVVRQFNMVNGIASWVVCVVLLALSLAEGLYSEMTYVQDTERSDSLESLHELVPSFGDAGQNEYAPARSYQVFKGGVPFGGGGLEVDSYSHSGYTTYLTVHSEQGGEIFLPLFCFKYQVLDDANFQGEAHIAPSDDDVMMLTLGPNSSGDLVIRFEPPWAWDAALIVTYLSVAGLMVHLVVKRRHQLRAARACRS